MPIEQTRKIRVTVREEPIARLAEQGDIAVAFPVDRVMEVIPSPGGRGSMLLREMPIRHPYEKNYDAIPGNAPADWSTRFRTGSWVLLTAYQREQRVGGVVIAPPGTDDGLPHTSGVAVLWDLRVHPEWRGQGVGSALFKAAEAWARAKGLRSLEAETQNVNVAACRFYERMRCQLVSAEPGAYPDFPDEVRLMFRKTLG